VTFSSNTAGATATCAAGTAVAGGWTYNSWAFADSCMQYGETRSDTSWSVSLYSPPNNCSGQTFHAWVVCCTP
jgi:hypothetical protein